MLVVLTFDLEDTTDYDPVYEALEKVGLKTTLIDDGGAEARLPTTTCAAQAEGSTDMLFPAYRDRAKKVFDELDVHGRFFLAVHGTWCVLEF